jgi:hypothetical protein
MDAVPDWILARPLAFRERPRHERDARRVHHIARVECAPADERQAEGRR